MEPETKSEEQLVTDAFVLEVKALQEKYSRALVPQLEMIPAVDGAFKLVISVLIKKHEETKNDEAVSTEKASEEVTN